MRLIDELIPRGRLARTGFLVRHLTVVPAALVAQSLAIDHLGRPWDLPFALLVLVLLVSAWGRRLHDRGRSAAWLLVAAVPVAGALWLVAECVFRRSAPSPAAARHGPVPGTPPDYLAVGS